MTKTIRLYTSRGWFQSGDIDSNGEVMIRAIFTRIFKDAAIFPTEEIARRHAHLLSHLKAILLMELPL